MHPLSIGKNYCLRLPDGSALGHVRIERFEDAWAEGPFTPSPAFERYRELFEREATLRHDQIIPLWEEAADSIDALKIQVVAEGEGVVASKLTVFLEGSQAIIGTEALVP